MKSLLFSYLFVCFFLVAKGQDYNNYIYSNKALNIPENETYSTASIAAYLQSNFTTDKEKLLTAYLWVTANIRYDKDSMYNINWGPDPKVRVSSALRRRKGVCENFAAIFSDISAKCGIPSFVVTGYTLQSGAVKRAGHSWSAVCLDKEWLLCDPTWDAGPGGRTNFFLVTPTEFITSHMPFDPLWQLLQYPASNREFSRGNFFARKQEAPLSVADSVAGFLQLDSLHQLEASLRRIKQAGLENDMVDVWRSYVNMKIAIVYEGQDMNLYNSAVADLNNANAIFNNFVEYRNSRFIPTKPDAEIRAMLDPIADIVSAAEKKLHQIGKSVENLQYDPVPIQKRLAALTLRVREQQHFLKQYVESSLADRGKLFYK
jgi:hypothetical protein